MIRTIRVDLVLREAVATPYAVLVTRSTGAAVRGRIQAVLAESDCETALLDFSAVALLDFSCADEVVAKLLGTDAAQRCCVVLRGLCEEQREAIEHVLAQQGLAVAEARDEPPTPALALLGAAPADLRAAFEALGRAGRPLGAEELAAELGWPPAHAAEALAALAARRVLRPEHDRAHVRYRVPLTPTEDAA